MFNLAVFLLSLSFEYIHVRAILARIREKIMLLTSIISLILFSSSPEVQTTPNGWNFREANLVFRWDRSNYEDSYLGNAEAADKLFNLIEEIGEESIDSVSVVAYASPEGVYEHNLKLSRNRAREFNTAVKQRIGLLEKKFPIRVTAGGEAWELLRSRVAADYTLSEDAKSRIIALLDNTSIPNDTKKWRMMHNALGSTLQEGDVYHWLLLNHYRYLRCLAITIYVKDVDIHASEDTDGRKVSGNLETETTVVDQPEEEKGDSQDKPENDVKDDENDGSSVISTETEGEAERSHDDEMPDIPDANWKGERIGTPIIGISTNLIYDATYIPKYGFTSVPSFSLEYYPARGHWTFGADVDWSHWLHYQEHRFNQIHNLTLHARRYFKEGDFGFHGLYLMGGLNAVQYGLGWDAKGWEGEGAGISAGIGHKWNWGSFFLDLGMDIGFLYSKYDPYIWGNDANLWYYYDYAGDPNEFVSRRMVLTWFGPIRAYISVGFDLFKRKK